MNDLQKFLAWFEGFSENISSVPTAEQWERVKGKIVLLDAACIAYSDGGGVMAAPPPPPKPVKPSTPTQWKAMYQGRLIELGVDMDSAREFAHDVAVNMDVMPDIQAEADVATLLN